ncbi:hypothetical protein [Streptomyces sp. DG1A-41]|uniref:hypothetical protein n=1 Tax=Streptomyces sp. DG1A-41 TaxID=3125779 RepID=UPI0030CF0F6E
MLNGPGPRPAQATDVTVADVDSALEATVSPHIRLVSLALPAMRARDWGRVLAVGSSGVAVPLANLALSNLAGPRRPVASRRRPPRSPRTA